MLLLTSNMQWLMWIAKLILCPSNKLKMTRENMEFFFFKSHLLITRFKRWASYLFTFQVLMELPKFIQLNSGFGSRWFTKDKQLKWKSCLYFIIDWNRVELNYYYWNLLQGAITKTLLSKSIIIRQDQLKMREITSLGVPPVNIEEEKLITMEG